MPGITTFIPKEFFFEGITDLQVLIIIIIVIGIIIFFGYKLFRATSSRKRPEYF